MVKDEETNLERCLQSLQPLMQEISSELIIVDTGSTDGTVVIAKQYTDKVYYHLWNNNFSEMRNISIGYATGEWILIIDADEALENYDGIVRILTSRPDRKIGGVALLVKNITNQSGDVYVGTMSPRIFRRNHEFRYQGVVHNEPIYKGSVIDSGNALFHYGYIHSDKALMERKFQRTSTLLKSELEKNPNNFYYRYQLGISYSMHGDKELSLRQFENLYLQYQYEDGVLRKNIYIFGVLLQAFLANGQLGEEVIRAGVHGLRLEPEYLDLYFYLGNVFDLRGEYEEAYSYFAKHADLVSRFGELKIRLKLAINHYTLDKQADDHYNMAFVSYKSKDYGKARLHIDQALNMVGQNVELARRIQSLVLEVDINDKNYKNCRTIYEKILTCNQPEDIQKLEEHLEKHWQQLSGEDRQSYCDNFQDVPGLYGLLNRIRIQAVEVSREEWLDTLENMDGGELNALPAYYAPLLVYLMEVYPQDVWRCSSYFSEQTLVEYMKYMDEVDKSWFVNMCRKFVEILPVDGANQYQIARIKKNMAKYLLFSGVLDEMEYKDIFATYIEAGKNYLETLYSAIMFEQELIYDLKNREEMFLLYMVLAERFAGDGSEVVKYLKKALAVYPEMSKGVKIALQSLSNQEGNSEMEQLIEKLLVIVEGHIADKQFDEALKIVLECEDILGKNLRLLAKKAEIYQKKYEN